MSEINKSYIESRVQDWIYRVNDIYSLVKETLSSINGIEFSETKNVSMHEELMQQYDVSPVNLPVLEIRNKEELIDSFKPIGLWVIGANGRIDILTKRGSYILVDTSENESSSKWKVYAPENRKESVDFDEAFIKALV